MFLKIAQRLLERAYNKEGLTEDVLDLQLQLNDIRYKYDLNETKDDFVQ